MATGGQKEVGYSLVKVGTMALENTDLRPWYTDLVVSGDMIMVVDCHEWTVKLHRLLDGRLLATTDKLGSEPRGICVINHTEICVIMLDSQIEIMSVQCTGDTGAITRGRTLQVKGGFNYCYQAAKFMDKVVVCGSKKDNMICWCIVSLTDGHVDIIHQICQGNLMSRSYLTTKESMIYISCNAGEHSENTGVHIYNTKNPSRQKYIYSHDELKLPRGITVDTRGFIFVCNLYPSCIHHLTEQYKLVTIYREEIPSSPRAIFWNQQDGHFYLTSWMSKVITQYKPQYPQGLPPEILKMDEHFQKLYREALANGEEEVCNIRVMIVGHQGVGKTSLTQHLLGKEIKEYETQPTEGIEVYAKCCQIDHATGEWRRKTETDELYLNDQRVASILHKYKSSSNNKDTEVIDPGEKPRISPHSSFAEPSPSGGITENKNSISNKQAAESSHEDNSRPVQKQKETEGGTYPGEIMNFVERVHSLLIPNTRSSDVTLLDFAGQSLFYTTHQAFMSWRTIYLLVTDMSRPLGDSVEEGAYSIDMSGKRTCSIQEYVTYWLNSIHSRVHISEDDKVQRGGNKPGGGEGSSSVQKTTGNHPCVILVGTHSDKIPEELLDERKKSYFNDIRISLKKRPLLFHLVDEDFAISNLGSDPNINALKTKIFDVARNQEYWGKPIPARWIPLERRLMEFKNRGIQVMEYADVKSLSETCQVRIEQPEELDLFLRFEHDIGNLIFFSTERLRKKIVLDPVWLIHGVRIWITSDEVIKRHPELLGQWSDFKNTGRLTSAFIEKLWSPHSAVLQNKEHLLDVMEKLSIIAKPLQKKKESGEEEEKCYWVPCMVSMPAPDDVKKLQQNQETTKTSTLCFRSRTKFIHVGVFHRLLATCLSKWAPAKKKNTYHLFRELCVFDLDKKHQLLLSLNDYVIQATVIRWTKEGRTPDFPLCKNIRDYLYSALSEISECLCPGSELEICIKCKESSPLSNEGLHSISTLQTDDELKCRGHEDHCVQSRELLGFWEEDKKQIPNSVLHSAHRRERFS